MSLWHILSVQIGYKILTSMTCTMWKADTITFPLPSEIRLATNLHDQNGVNIIATCTYPVLHYPWTSWFKDTNRLDKSCLSGVTKNNIIIQWYNPAAIKVQYYMTIRACQHLLWGYLEKIQHLKAAFSDEEYMNHKTWVNVTNNSKAHFSMVVCLKSTFSQITPHFS